MLNAAQFLDEALTPALAGKSSSERLLSLRSDLRGRQGRWQEAAADAALAFSYQPTDRGLYSKLAALLVEANKRSEYKQFCGRLLQTFGDTTNVYIADQVAKACLFLPVSGLDTGAVYRLADLPVTRGTDDQYAMPFFQVCKALSEYRQGHYKAAIEWAQQPLKIDGNYSHWHAYGVLALANWQLGNTDEAPALLAKGENLAPRSMPPSVAEDPGDAWLAWLYARIQLDEATALIQPGPAAEH